MTTTTDHIYPEVYGIRIEGSPAPAPKFPNECPCCGAETSGGKNTEHPNSPWVTNIYACGGEYKPKPQIQNHTHIWWGSCPKAKLAKPTGLDPRTTPLGIIEDWLKEHGQMSH